VITATPDKPKRIAITLDDGPNEPYTSQLLDFLDEAGVRVTLFQVGRCIERYPETTMRAYAAGHVIGNHSFTHQFHKYLVQPRMIREIDSTQKLIHSLIGRTPLLLRAPWFMHTPGLRGTATDRSLSFVTGALPHPIEILQPKASSIAGHALKHAGDGAILIFHDGYRWRRGFRGHTIEAVKVVVTELKRQGYTFVTANELLNVPAYL
jgi:peptidoglycan/xylan/chitin deacetylase (PgdA/CDA1 family)